MRGLAVWWAPCDIYGKIYARDNLRQQVSSPLAQLIRGGALADEGPTVLQATTPRVRDAGLKVEKRDAGELRCEYTERRSNTKAKLIVGCVLFDPKRHSSN